MTSQLRHNFLASQAVHGADDVITPHFKSQVDSLGVCGPKLILLTTLPQKAGVPNLAKIALNIQPSLYKFLSCF